MIRPGLRLRNLCIATLAMIVIYLLAGWQLPARASFPRAPVAAPLPQNATFTFTTNPVEVEPGSNVTASATLQNTGSVTDTFTISTDIATNPGWTATPSADSVALGPNEQVTVTFLITAPDSATDGITLTASATNTGGDIFNGFLQVNLDTPGIVDVNLTVRNEDELEGTPGEAVDFDLRVSNNGDDEVSITLNIDDVVNCDRDIPGCNDSVSRSSVTVTPGSFEDFSVSVLLPSDAPIGAEATTRVVALVDGEVQDTEDVVTRVIQPTATPTETFTPSPTNTPVPTLAPVCRDAFEDDDNRGSAKVIDVNLPQPQQIPPDPEEDDRRAICPPGDEDWLVFGAVEGKVYTIDVREVTLGLDLSLELTDEDGNQLAFNDDFYERDPASPNASDINPRIQSWRAPYTGLFYIRVREVADRGGVDRTYQIELQSESYGPTPSTVVEICEDEFEPDGLPEQANLIVSNEIQFERRLCPTGDADWVTFFGREDKRYFVYTDTRPYINSNPANPEAEAGADTVIVLTDRDGVSVIDVNDDIPGGSTLDSQIEFVPEVDGFYYVQVKNVGDIGSQFIVYDLILELCIPGSTVCGREISLAAQGLTQGLAPVTSPAPTPTTTAQTPTAAEVVSLDGTPTPTIGTPTANPGVQ